MTHDEALGLLGQVLPKIRRQLERWPLAHFATEFLAWRRRQPAVLIDRDERVNVCAWLRETLLANAGNIEEWRRRHNVFQQRLAGSSDEGERTRAIVDFLLQLGSRGRQLKADRAAMRRWLGADAIADRVHTRIANSERNLVLGLELLGLHSQQLVASLGQKKRSELWLKLNLEAIALPLFDYEGAPQVRLAAIRMLACVVIELPALSREAALDIRSVQFIYRTAQEPQPDPWPQCQALLLLSELAPASASRIITERLTVHRSGDDFFVRRQALRLAATLLAGQPELATTLTNATQDPSDYVRQALAERLADLPAALANTLMPKLVGDDASPQVRASATLALASRLGDTDHGVLRATLAQLLRAEQSAFVLRTGMLTARRIVEQLHDSPASLATWLAALTPVLRDLHTGARELKVRRWAAMTLESLRVNADPRQRRLLQQLDLSLGQEGAQTPLPAELATLPTDELGRLASVAAQTDFGLHIHRNWRGLRVRRGHRFVRRLWRILHEWRHPSPDKRQAHLHTIGRVFSGKLHAPSAILAELSQTKVPGEPLHFASEDGWRPYLPLIDQLLSLLDDPGDPSPLRIASAEGMTAITAPATLSGRIAASARLTLRFAHYAALRNWSEDSHQPAEAYCKELRALGFGVHFTPWEENGSDPAVSRFFPIAWMPLPLEEVWRRFENYFFSAYENSLGQLALFVAGALSLFIGRHVLANLALRRARAAIPLVIGGWGTRGKSGVERLKAALFNGLGYSVLSKTTGCEAMFLYSAPYQPLREMFLFRPYDKATIWEQHNVTCLAARLKVDVMLWECMALTPSFVTLLQKCWMRDDLTTITNTFPDHEDIQGPAGIDIPRVMTHFIPQGGHLISSEEQMRPILTESARACSTPMDNVGWLESDLITDDVRARFPDEAHPDNLALVVRLARELGVEADFALREMADRVVPDIGVLKLFAPAAVNGRRLSFANGMSANERFGCLNNWRRLGFDRHDPDRSPGELICTVVNNRADRIARSRVFAAILVEDIEADYHFLIGSNLDGLLGYVRGNWTAQVNKITLWTETGVSAEDVLEIQARRLRIPFNEARLRARLAAMLGESGDDDLIAHWSAPDTLQAQLETRHDPYAGEISDCLRGELAIYREYQDLLARVRAPGTDAPARQALNADLRAALGRWFERKLIVVTDFHASGNEIIRLIARQTPPRMHSRVMGIQNIKGTGLDFVYRWLAWEHCHRAGQHLSSTDPGIFRRGLGELAQFSDFGVLTDVYLQTTLAQAGLSPLAQDERIQSELKTIENRRQMVMAKIAAERETSQHSHLTRFANLIEGFFDAGDAIRRRRYANRIYRALITQRISQTQASEELLRLTLRQKGGWLAGALTTRLQGLIDWWETRTRRFWNSAAGASKVHR